MDRLYKPSYLKEVLSRHGFEFSKAFGQNFLIDGNIVRQIVEKSGLGPEDLGIEIGPGAGTLTQELSLKAKKVIAIELDDRLLPILEETTGDNVEVILGDALEVDLSGLIEEAGTRSARLVANLPYNVGTIIAAKILEERIPLDSMTIMLQKEVGERMLAKPGAKDYGALSLLVDYFTDSVEAALMVPRTVFMPQPNVDSIVVKLNIKEVEEKPYEDIMFKTIRGAFTQRRKTILNSLTVGTGIKKKDIRKILEDLDLDPSLRAEDLTIDDFERIGEKIYQLFS